MRIFQGRTVLLASALIAVAFAAYSNHFENSFHFDDSHSVVDNAYIRDVRNVPLFFTDVRTFSNLPANRAFRPLIPLSLAIDYRLGKGLKPFWFHASTFFWFLVQLLLMQLLFQRICDIAVPDGRNRWTAWFAAALYAAHPANAETINYVIQRGDVFSTVGVVAGLAVYAVAPRLRRFGLYLLPVAAALLSKPPALVFPAILFAYIYLMEEARPLEALRKCLPALAVSGIFAVLTSAMTPKGFVSGAGSAFAYRITQPLVALRYFRNFFLPDRLSADTDHAPLTGIFDGYAWAGFLFVGAVLMVAIQCSRRREWRPAAFGLWWFLLALLPTAIFPLAEVENDHRMYFPFVGLALAVCWPVALWWRGTELLPASRKSLFGFAPGHARPILAAVCGLVLAVSIAGARERNRVWHDEESLWYDVTLKSPLNGRGLMNYGLTQMAKGDLPRALEYFQRATAFTPNYSTLEINLGVVTGALHRNDDAREHFRRAVQLAPGDALTHFFYARWLEGNRNYPEAQAELQAALLANPDHLLARYLSMESAAATGDWTLVNATAKETLRRFPADTTAAWYISHPPAANSKPPQPRTAEEYLNLSVAWHRAGKYHEAIAAAQETLRLKPDSAEAFNNIAAAYEEMADWDRAIVAARQALKLKPDFQLARNNLLWSEQQKKKQQGQRSGD